MPTLRWTGRGYFSHRGEMYSPGSTADVDEGTADELLNHRTGDWERVDESDGESGGGDDEDSTDAPVDPHDFTVAEFEDHMSDTDYSDAELDALAEAEGPEDGDGRAGIHDAIDGARDGGE